MFPEVKKLFVLTLNEELGGFVISQYGAHYIGSDSVKELGEDGVKETHLKKQGEG